MQHNLSQNDSIQILYINQIRGVFSVDVHVVLLFALSLLQELAPQTPPHRKGPPSPGLAHGGLRASSHGAKVSKNGTEKYL